MMKGHLAAIILRQQASLKGHKATRIPAARRQGEPQGLTGEGSTLLAIASFRLSIADFGLPIGFPKQRRAALCASPRHGVLATHQGRKCPPKIHGDEEVGGPQPMNP
jgi:hypothetical protein